MARRGNYGAEKRQRELKKKKKREEKLARKRQANAPAEDETAVDAEGTVEGAAEEAGPASEVPAGDTQAPNDAAEPASAPDATGTPEATTPSGADTGDGLGVIELPDLGFKLEKPSMPSKKSTPAVELDKSIFRAYDIRGIVGETLDADIARQVGQVVGTLALEQDAADHVIGPPAEDGNLAHFPSPSRRCMPGFPVFRSTPMESPFGSCPATQCVSPSK